MAVAADAPTNEDARLFEVWKGSLAVCLGILAKAGRGALASSDGGEACGALTSLLGGATGAASALEAHFGELRASLAGALGVVDELRDLVAAQQAALATREAKRAGATASRGCQTDAAPTDEEARLAARVRELEDCVAAEREATRIAKVVCETLQRKASRAEDDAADARQTATAAKAKARSLERIVAHYEAIGDHRRDDAERPARGDDGAAGS